MTSPPAIRVENLSKTYRSTFGRQTVEALREASLEVAPGEIFGLLGPNGAGKTTLVKILLGVVKPSEGTAALFGKDAGTPAARRRVGYLPESHRFPGHLSPEKMLDLYGRLQGVPSAARKRRIPELLERVDMAEWQDTKIRKFSKGMLQRTGLAQALLGDPDLVFLDEPTDGVDPVGRRAIRDLLLWMRSEGKTVFLNSHLLSEVEQVCTRVAILNDGRLVRQGSIEELTAVERVYDLVATPLPERALDAAEGAVTEAGPAKEEGLRRYRLVAESRAHLNRLLDSLRRAGVEIDALMPQRRTLEDYFIDVVEGERGTEREGERMSGREQPATT